MPLARLFRQEQTPVFTGISLFTTVVVETSIVWIANALPGSGTNGIGGVVLGAFLTGAGCLINAVAGTIAHGRREYWGGRIAACGTTAWFATILALLVW